MPVTQEIDEALIVPPYDGDTSPVMFGVEHEYQRPNRGPGCIALPYGWREHSEHCGWEIKTPPSTDIASVMETFREIEEAIGDGGHRNCGLHVHLNADPTAGPAMNPLKFAELYRRHRPYLWSIVPFRDRSGYDRVGVTDPFGRSYAAALTDEQMQMPVDQLLDHHNAKYSEMFFGHLTGHGTIEIRLAAATGDMDRFELWLRTLVQLASMARYTKRHPTTELRPFVDVLRRPDGTPQHPNYGQSAWESDATGDANLIGQFVAHKIGKAASVRTILSTKRATTLAPADRPTVEV